MASVTFILRDPKGDGPQPVSLLFRWNNQRAKIATGLKVIPKHWNQDNQRVRNVVAATDKDLVNELLGKLEKAAKSYYLHCQSQDLIFSSENLKKHLECIIDPSKGIDVNNTLFGFIDRFIEDTSNGRLLRHGQKASFRTIQRYKTVQTRLLEFQGKYRRKIDFQTIDLDFYEDFTKYLTQEKGYAVNNIGKYIAILKVFLNAATEKGLNTNIQFKQRAFRTIEEDTDSIYLTERELKLFEELDLSHNARLDRVRDLFLIGAFTGLRFSDYTVIKPENIKKDPNGDFIELYQQKTRHKVKIPIVDNVRSILEKYGWQSPPVISNQKMNDYLKELAQMVGLTEKVSKSITKSGRHITKVYEKWELVSSHTARRSFASNAFNRGIPSLLIMEITGHRTEKAFLKYIKLDSDQKARLFLAQWNKASQEPERPKLKVV